MQHAEALGDDGSGGVRVGQGTEGAGGDDGEEHDSAEPEDDEQQNDGADGGLHI